MFDGCQQADRTDKHYPFITNLKVVQRKVAEPNV